MTAADLPPDPDEPPPTKKEMWDAARSFGIAVLILLALMAAIPFIRR